MYTATREFSIFLEMAVGWRGLWNYAGISQAPAFDVFGIVPKIDQLWHSAGDICISRTPSTNHVIQKSNIHDSFYATYGIHSDTLHKTNHIVTLKEARIHLLYCILMKDGSTLQYGPTRQQKCILVCCPKSIMSERSAEL